MGGLLGGVAGGVLSLALHTAGTVVAPVAPVVSQVSQPIRPVLETLTRTVTRAAAPVTGTLPSVAGPAAEQTSHGTQAAAPKIAGTEPAGATSRGAAPPAHDNRSTPLARALRGAVLGASADVENFRLGRPLSTGAPLLGLGVSGSLDALAGWLAGLLRATWWLALACAVCTIVGAMELRVRRKSLRIA